MLATVALNRLDRIKDGKDAKTGKRCYSTHQVTDDDLKEIQRGILFALGLSKLTIHL